MVGLSDEGGGAGAGSGEGASGQGGEVSVGEMFSRLIAQLVNQGRVVAPVLRVDRVAEWLGVGERAVRKMMDRGEIPWAWQGRQRVVPLQCWLDRLAAQAKANEPPQCAN